jgi:hypothetical protein
MPVTTSITQFASRIQPEDTIDDFLDKLEVLLDCKDAGYTECFNRVKDLVNTKTNKQLHGYKKGYERVKQHNETLLKLYEEQRATNRKLREQLEKQKNKAKHSSMIIPDRDKRISPITMRMSYGYVRDWIEDTQIGDMIADEWWDTDKCDDVMEDVAQAIESEINDYITAYEHNDLKDKVYDRVWDELVNHDKLD